MAYQVLARKWRPRNFQEVMCQAPVVQALSNALNQKRLHHAYLFTGTRGVGKTSIARILAKCLHCVQGPTSTPCEVCGPCMAIQTGQSVDLIEVDAASRTKVEDTRELLSNMQYAPTSGRYKIYLIDEVHMLSGHSFNALLKTLEEPPPHIIFLLATTDPQKLPATVLSRCLQFHLRAMPPHAIASHLGRILSKENIPYEEIALHAIAHAADGSMRDALSLLDQAIAYGNHCVKNQAVMRLLGSTPHQYLIELIYQLTQQDSKALLQVVQQLHEQSIDFMRTVEGLLSLLHHIAILQTAPDLPIDNAWQDADAIKELASILSSETVQLYYQIALTGRRDLPLATHPKEGFDMLVLRMLALANGPTHTTPPSTPDSPKQKEKASNSLEVPSKKEQALKPPERLLNEEKSIPTEEEANKNNWPALLDKFGLTGMTYTLAAHCTLEKLCENDLFLILAPKHAPLLTSKQKDRLTEAVNRYFKRPMQVKITLAESAQKSPMALIQQTANQKQVAAQQTLQRDPTLQSVIKQFDAALIPESIRPWEDS